jgi:tetratricopeptide (TPR) repeat protein
MKTAMSRHVFRSWPVFLVSLFTLQLTLQSHASSWEERALSAFDQGELDLAQSLAEEALRDRESQAAAHELLGRIALTQRRNEEAVSHFSLARGGGRQSEELARGWAAALTNLGKHEEACRVLEDELRRSSSAELRYRLASSYLAQGNSREALPHLEEAYRLGLRHAGVQMRLARARFSAGQDDRAVELLESLSRESASENLLYEAGKLLFDHLFYRQALIPLHKAWDQRLGSYEIGMYLALSHYLIQEYSQSEAVLSAIQTGSPLPLDYLILRGSVDARLGHWQQAREELEGAIKQAPNRADGFLNLGLLCLERGETQRAMELLEKGSAMMVKGTKLLYYIKAPEACEGLVPPEGSESRDTMRGDFYSRLAAKLYTREQPGSSLELYRLALDFDSRSSIAYAGLGKICWEMDSFKVAQRFLERGLVLNPNAPELYFNLGLIRQSLSQGDEAVKSYQKAIELKGPDVPALYWVQLGTAQLASPKSGLADAEASFRKGLDRDPNFAQAYYELGKLYFQRKEFDRAEESLEKAITLDPKLLRAYYQYGMTCLRNGKPEKGKMLLDTFKRKRALQTTTGMEKGDRG